MSDDSLSEIILELEGAISGCDGRRLKEAVYRLETFLLGIRDYPDMLFDYVKKTLDENPIHGVPDSYHLLKHLYDERNRLSQAQKESLLGPIERGFSRYKDFMAAFVTAELIPVLFPDTIGYQALMRIKNGNLPGHRSLIPHGFEWLVRNATDEKVQTMAVGQINGMMNDPLEEVRLEAAASLAQLRRKGFIK